jgi:hypothetical protein
MGQRTRRYVVRVTVTLVLLPLLLFAGMVFFARIESRPSGVHQRLLLPLFGAGYVKVAMPAGTGDQARVPGLFEGPVVTPAARQAWSARWFCEDRVEHAQGTGGTLQIACAGKRYSYAMAAPQAYQAAVVPMPEKLLVLSDIEGNIAFLDGALRKLGVVDADGAWSFGANRVVIAGDSVDRGRDVSAVLWRLQQLAGQARAAGGGLHVVLGNHDQYLLRGNTAKAHPEHLYAIEQLGGPAKAFARDTVLGAWLRTQPVIVKVGRVLIAHGGVSPAVARQGLSVQQLNQAMRGYWLRAAVPAADLDAVLGEQGVTQYRGYLQAPLASADDVAAALRAFDADTIVVGHSIVDKVTRLYDSRVFAIDVNSNSAAPEALLFVNGVATVVDTGTPRALPDDQQKGALRPINLLGGEDWRTLARVTRRTLELAQLPFPY